MTDPILIIGGGIIGMMTARELHAAGQPVTLIERGQPGREASWAGGGILSPLFPWRYLDSITRLAAWSQAHYAALCEQLRQDSGIDPEYTRNGMLMTASDEIEQARVWAQRHQRPLQLIDRQTFAKLEPQAAHPPETGLWMPQVAQVRNPRLGAALLADLRRRGIEILSDTQVESLSCQGDRCAGAQTSRGFVRAAQVIVCAGAWSGGLLQDLPAAPTIGPIRGQMILFQTQPGTLSRIMLEAQRYAIPRRDGHLLFGSSMEDVGFDKSTTAAMHDELHAIAIERFPVLADCPVVKHWAGLRPSSPAGVPYIARHPRISNLLINAGQFRNGVVLAPASARLAADLTLNRTPILDPAPYSWTAARG